MKFLLRNKLHAIPLLPVIPLLLHWNWSNNHLPNNKMFKYNRHWFLLLLLVWPPNKWQNSEANWTWST